MTWTHMVMAMSNRHPPEWTRRLVAMRVRVVILRQVAEEAFLRSDPQAGTRVTKASLLPCPERTFWEVRPLPRRGQHTGAVWGHPERHS